MMLNLIGAVAVALAASGGMSSAEPPPPPYDWDATPVAFAPFYAVGPVPRPGAVHEVNYAAYPEEGRALCAYFQRWDYPNDPLWDCLVKPLSEQPDVTQPGWIDEYAPSWAR
jgi:hypothetical protein